MVNCLNISHNKPKNVPPHSHVLFVLKWFLSLTWKKKFLYLSLGGKKDGKNSRDTKTNIKLVKWRNYNMTRFQTQVIFIVIVHEVTNGELEFQIECWVCVNVTIRTDDVIRLLTYVSVILIFSLNWTFVWNCSLLKVFDCTTPNNLRNPDSPICSFLWDNTDRTMLFSLIGLRPYHLFSRIIRIIYTPGRS